MNDIQMPHAAWGGMLAAVTVLYSAWQEFKAKIRRDTHLLALTGAISVAGSSAILCL